MFKLTILALLILIAACQTAPSAPPTYSGVVFPTMTAGRVINAPLPSPLPGQLNPGVANPATLIAQANQPTATPDYARCPSVNSTVALAAVPPSSAAEIDLAITEYLSLGGQPAVLDETLRGPWGDILGEPGFARSDIDLTGEGVPDVIAAYRSPDIGSAVAIYVCAAGRYLSRYQALPQGGVIDITRNEDMNYDGRPEVFYTSQQCINPDDPDSCEVYSQVLTWNTTQGRFVNLLDDIVISQSVPTIEDYDQDRVLEIVVRLEDAGNAQTGPLPTGFTVYDWNGVVYTRSITQVDPPRFRVQVIHQADAAFELRNTLEAEGLYRFAVTDEQLQNWNNDDRTTLRDYALYRLLLVYAEMDDPRLIETHQAVLTLYPDLASAPVYAQMADAFFNAYQSSANLNSACGSVLGIISGRPEAVTLLNRYGSTSPDYTAEALCPY